MHSAFYRRDLFRGDRFRRFYLGIKSLVERILDFHSHVTQHIHDRLQIDQRQAVLIYQIRTVGPHIQKPHATVPVQQKSQFFILAIHIGQQHPVRKFRLIPISQFPDRYRFVYRKFFVRRTDLRLQFDFHNPSSFDFFTICYCYYTLCTDQIQPQDFRHRFAWRQSHEKRSLHAGSLLRL